MRYWSIKGKECEIILQRRPWYCDRGNFLARLDLARGSTLLREIDRADGWPRYYFSESVARSECEAWLQKRGQWVEGAQWQEVHS